MTSSSNMIACPKCGSYVDFEPVTVIYPDSPELELMVQGNLNRILCTECHVEFVCQTPILYRDDEKRTVIYYLPESFCPDVHAATEKMQAIFDQMFAESGESVRPKSRLVTQRSDFVEKIEIVLRDYDDRMIEYVKYMLYQNSDDLDPEKHELLFDFTSDNDKSLNFIAFKREDHTADYSMEFNLDDYAELEAFFCSSKEASAKLDDLYPPNLVSVNVLLDYDGELSSDNR